MRNESRRKDSARISFHDPQSAFRRGFTLTELLVVISLIVLILAMALPAFNFITGSKSVDAGINIITAFVARSRAEALDRGKITGVMFYIDRTTQRRMMTLVTETDTKGDGTIDNPDIDVYLNLIADREPIPVPRGIDVQFIDNGTRAPGSLTANGHPKLGAPYLDRYLGFNTVLSTAKPIATNVLYNSATPIGGVILFDGSGKLVSVRYAFRCSTAANNTLITRMMQMIDPSLDPNAASPPMKVDALIRPSGTTTDRFLRSQVGLAVFDQDAFTSAGGTPQDYECNTGQINIDTEADEEFWLDENAIPLLVNRYNGTLVKGQ